MSVLIKGMEMPTSCLSCPLQGGTADCRLTQKTYNWGLSERPSDCPLIPVPPHGRLIDKDALLEDIDSNHIVTPSDDGNLVEVYGAEKILAHIAYAPTVIEAEGGDA